MQAIIENGGGDSRTYVDMYTFLSILDTICIAEDSEELITLLDRVRHRNLKRSEPFNYSFGVTSSGVEVYYNNNPKRLIFVSCETDVEC